MLVAFSQWLDGAAPVVFWTCAAVLIALDGYAVAAVASTKSRELVNKWTGPVLVANALLLGTGIAVPTAMRITSAAVMAVAPGGVPASPLAPADAAPVEAVRASSALR